MVINLKLTCIPRPANLSILLLLPSVLLCTWIPLKHFSIKKINTYMIHNYLESKEKLLKMSPKCNTHPKIFNTFIFENLTPVSWLGPWLWIWHILFHYSKLVLPWQSWHLGWIIAPLYTDTRWQFWTRTGSCLLDWNPRWEARLSWHPTRLKTIWNCNFIKLWRSSLPLPPINIIFASLNT